MRREPLKDGFGSIFFSAHGHLKERLWGKSSDGRNEVKG